MGWKNPIIFVGFFLASLRQASPRNLMEQIAFDIEETPDTAVGVGSNEYKYIPEI